MDPLEKLLQAPLEWRKLNDEQKGWFGPASIVTGGSWGGAAPVGGVDLGARVEEEGGERQRSWMTRSGIWMCAGGGREQSEVELGSGECAMQSGKLICFVALGALLGATVGWSSNASCDVVRGALSALLHIMAHLFNVMFFWALFQPAALPAR